MLKGATFTIHHIFHTKDISMHIMYTNILFRIERFHKGKLISKKTNIFVWFKDAKA